MTAQPNAQVRFRRAIERRALWLAENAMREMGVVTLQEAHDVLVLYAEWGSPKYEKAAGGEPNTSARETLAHGHPAPTRA